MPSTKAPSAAEAVTPAARAARVSLQRRQPGHGEGEVARNAARGEVDVDVGRAEADPDGGGRQVARQAGQTHETAQVCRDLGGGRDHDRPDRPDGVAQEVVDGVGVHPVGAQDPQVGEQVAEGRRGGPQPGSDLRQEDLDLGQRRRRRRAVAVAGDHPRFAVGREGPGLVERELRRAVAPIEGEVRGRLDPADLQVPLTSARAADEPAVGHPEVHVDDDLSQRLDVGGGVPRAEQVDPGADAHEEPAEVQVEDGQVDPDVDLGGRPRRRRRSIRRRRGPRVDAGDHHRGEGGTCVELGHAAEDRVDLRRGGQCLGRRRGQVVGRRDRGSATDELPAAAKRAAADGRQGVGPGGQRVGDEPLEEPDGIAAETSREGGEGDVGPWRADRHERGGQRLAPGRAHHRDTGGAVADEDDRCRPGREDGDEALGLGCDGVVVGPCGGRCVRVGQADEPHPRVVGRHRRGRGAGRVDGVPRGLPVEPVVGAPDVDDGVRGDRHVVQDIAADPPRGDHLGVREAGQHGRGNARRWDRRHADDAVGPGPPGDQGGEAVAEPGPADEQVGEVGHARRYRPQRRRDGRAVGHGHAVPQVCVAWTADPQGPDEGAARDGPHGDARRSGVTGHRAAVWVGRPACADGAGEEPAGQQVGHRSERRADVAAVEGEVQQPVLDGAAGVGDEGGEAEVGTAPTPSDEVQERVDDLGAEASEQRRQDPLDLCPVRREGDLSGGRDLRQGYAAHLRQEGARVGPAQGEPVAEDPARQAGRGSPCDTDSQASEADRREVEVEDHRVGARGAQEDRAAAAAGEREVSGAEVGAQQHEVGAGGDDQVGEDRHRRVGPERDDERVAVPPGAEADPRHEVDHPGVDRRPGVARHGARPGEQVAQGAEDVGHRPPGDEHVVPVAPDRAERVRDEG